ncbi:MAG: CoA transferase [Rhodobiaceae bacterium]|nr:CoA transferase [Rhodobiaceae bacterium]MCC0015585.1 CoA transferase [Rhodobiaceae bacterium]MCC0042438.1 CoA transferase [Rhodobiaceae bacterium]MCC0054223.1 CoA transferase [Rhodobiaceae bacterium]
MSEPSSSTAGGSAGAGPLSGLRILDLSRILAGPFCTQFLGDLGADVIKIERPGEGDDTRRWGPPFLKGPDGTDTGESAYFQSANRNKRSVAVDISTAKGAGIIRSLALQMDILIENFKVGGLRKYGLGYDEIAAVKPDIVYCSISGFGQTGPYAPRPGYDYLAQGMGGIMSLTGEPDGQPMKVGVAIADVVCGLYAANAIQAALLERARSGKGQHIDLSLLDSQVSWLVNEGLNYLTSGKTPQRRGNQHPNIVPYQTFACADGHAIVAVGNDAQYRRLCEVLGTAELATDPRFATNPQRSVNRGELIPLLESAIARFARDDLLARLEAAGVPAGPVNTLDQVFDDPQVTSRGMRVAMPHPATGGEVELIGNPVKLSRTPVTYRLHPPMLGEHTREVLASMMGLDDAQIERLAEDGVIALAGRK